MNIAERLQREALAKKKQEVEKFSAGYTAIRELYEQEYRENKNKLSSEIKQDIKLISQKYPSFQKFALYRIYKQFDFNREIANEFISIQIQKEEQPDQGDDWIEVTSKKSAFMFKMDRDNQNNKPQRSQSVPRTSSRQQRGDGISYREKRNQEERRTNVSTDKIRNNSSDRRRNGSRERRRNNSGERDQGYQQRRRYSPKRDYQSPNQNQKNRKPKTQTRKPQQSGSYPYSYQPRVIYVPKQQEDDDCPYIPKSTIQLKENQISNINQAEEVKQNDLTEQIKQQEQVKREREAQIEKQRQEQEEQQRLEQIRQEELRQELIRNEQKRQEELRLEQQRLLRLEQLEIERQRQEQEQQERLKKEKAEQEQQRIEQQRIEEQRQYELMLQQQQAYQKQFTNSNQSGFQPIRTQQVNPMFVPQQQQYYQQQNQQQQQQHQQPSVYHMLMSYINYQ